jgi:hypothetical protein
MAGVISYPRGNCLPHLGVRIIGFTAVSVVLLMLLRLGVAPEVATGVVGALVLAGVRLVRP